MPATAAERTGQPPGAAPRASAAGSGSPPRARSTSLSAPRAGAMLAAQVTTTPSETAPHQVRRRDPHGRAGDRRVQRRHRLLEEPRRAGGEQRAQRRAEASAERSRARAPRRRGGSAGRVSRRRPRARRRAADLRRDAAIATAWWITRAPTTIAMQPVSPSAMRRPKSRLAHSGEAPPTAVTVARPETIRFQPLAARVEPPRERPASHRSHRRGRRGRASPAPRAGPSRRARRPAARWSSSQSRRPAT